MSQTTASPAAPRVAEAQTRGRTRRSPLLRPLLMLGGIVIVAIAALIFWLTGGRYVSIDDAYIQAPKVSVATDVSGIVADVPVHEGQVVSKGEVLLRLDPLRFQIAVSEAKANRDSLVSDLKAEVLDYQRMLRDVRVKQAQLASDQANLQRFANLVKSGGVTRAEYDNSRFQVQADQQGVDALKVQAEVQLAKLGGNPTPDIMHLAQYRAAQAKVDEAERQLRRSVIRAPFAGIVTQVDSVQPGMYLGASQAAFGLVATQRAWVTANPKETELTWVKPGDAVTVTVDTYPGHHWKGHVESISPVSGSEFSVLPAQNTSGNWVKVVQRIPVRIVIDEQKNGLPLRAGMSVEADIDTGHTRSLSDLF
ncbi:MAG: HlyD family secretion protein [Rhodospirillales bacterium]|nr:HlyD family secretion protein [Rhodospirillales bacterium]